MRHNTDFTLLQVDSAIEVASVIEADEAEAAVVVAEHQEEGEELLVVVVEEVEDSSQA